MTSQDDLDLIQERKIQDMRAFLVNALSDENAPRLAPALRAVRTLLLDGRWHHWTAALAAMLRASDVAVKSCESQLYNALKAGVIERRGDTTRNANRSIATDTREIRLKDWPDTP